MSDHCRYWRSLPKPAGWLTIWLLSSALLLAASFSLSSAAPPLEIEEAPAPLQELQPNSEAQQDRLHASALFSAGWLLEKRGKKIDALHKYQRAFRYDPQMNLLLQEILRLAAELDREEQAIQYVLLGVDQVPPDAKLLRPLALVLVRQGKWDQALQLYEVILRGISPDRTDFTSLSIRQEAGRLHYLTGQLAEGAEVSAVVEDALANPKKYELTADQEKELLGEPGLTYHLFAECYLAAGELDRARAAFETANSHQPSPGLYGYNLARVEEQAGNIDQALKHLEAYFTARLGSEGSAPYELLEKLLAKQKSGESLDKALARLRQADPTNTALTLFMAQRYLAAEKYVQAEPLFAELVKSGTRRKRDEIYQGLITCQQELHHVEALLETLTDTDPLLLSDVLPPLAADQKLREELLALAREKRKPTAEKLPPAKQSWVMAQLAMAGGDLEEAKAFYEFARQDQPGQGEDLARLFAIELLQADEQAEAIKFLEGLLKEEAKDRDELALQTLLATALAMDKQYDRALKFARHVQDSKPQGELPTSQVADILWQADRLEEAETEYAKRLLALEKHPDSESARREGAKIRQTLSHLALQRGDVPQSQEWLEQILDDYPADPGALNDLSYLWAERGQHPRRALRMIERAIEQEPDNPAFLDTLAWARYQVGEYAAAKEALQKALELMDEPDPVMLDHLGDICQQLDQKDAARGYWQQALELLPDGEEPQRRAALKAKLTTETNKTSAED